AVVSGFAVMAAISARRTARERDRARTAELAAERNAQQLANALSESRIERGRTLGTSGNVPAAEDVLWSEFLDPRYGDDPAAHFQPSQSRRRRVFWALWELYSAAPCRRTWQIHDAARYTVSLSRDGEILAAMGTTGLLNCWDVTSRRLIASDRVETHEPLALA